MLQVAINLIANPNLSALNMIETNTYPCPLSIVHIYNFLGKDLFDFTAKSNAVCNLYIRII